MGLVNLPEVRPSVPRGSVGRNGETPFVRAVSATHGRVSVLMTLFTFILLVSASVASAADHPSLIDPAKTRCTTCHAQKVDKANVHVATESCDTCHVFSKEEGSTTVELMDEPPALCVMCHGGLEAAAEGSMETPHFPVTDTCLNCHDPHSTDTPRLLTASVPSLCLNCHDTADLDESHGVAVSRADCSSCHVPHGSATASMLVEGEKHSPFAEGSCDSCHRRGMKTRAQKDSSRICFACHDSDPFEAAHVHTAVAEGNCLGCHDPHLSPNVAFTKAEGQDLCYSCHFEIEKKSEQVSVHAALESGCDSCHQPHTGEYENQLVDDMPALCMMCHDLEDDALSSKHLGADLEALACTSCHDPHGSPEAPLFAARSIHAPFADRTCEICHAGSSSELIENGTSDLCLACHSEIEEIVETAATPHMALEMVDCKDCHTPHASNSRKLLKEEEGQVCATCHDDKFAGEEEFQHGTIELLGCASCHEPHGGANEALLRDANVDQLCLGCHDAERWEQIDDDTVRLLGSFVVDATDTASMPVLDLTNGTRNHPILGHVTLGEVTDESVSGKSETPFRGTIGCLTCHDPHMGTAPNLFANGATEICSKCHAK